MESAMAAGTAVWSVDWIPGIIIICTMEDEKEATARQLIELANEISATELEATGVDGDRGKQHWTASEGSGVGRRWRAVVLDGDAGRRRRAATCGDREWRRRRCGDGTAMGTLEPIQHS
nr:hypothetical protein Iba_chr05bCG12050 [Ipomoea batatas]